MTTKTESPFHLVSEMLREFETRWDRTLISDIDLIQEVADYLKLSRGKRFRPALVFLSSEIFDADPGKLQSTALVIELIHIATLLHDDVIDESIIRRGMPSVFSKWNTKTAILMGDYLFTLAFDILVRENLGRMMRILAQASLKLAKGEMLDEETEGKPDLSMEAYNRVIGLKTASLISASCVTGAALTPSADEKTIQRYSELGYSLGYLYQMVDDILDYSGDAGQVGKPLRHDLHSWKVTLPFICAYENADRVERQELKRLFSGIRTDDGVARVTEMVFELGGVSGAEKVVFELGDKIKYSLETEFEPGANAIFSRIVDYLVSRRK
jgi:geranylgeranyl pyrophosphate synthase